MVSFKGLHLVRDMTLTCVRWSLASPLSNRQEENLMQEREVPIDHATINCWVLPSSPSLEERSTAAHAWSGTNRHLARFRLILLMALHTLALSHVAGLA